MRTYARLPPILVLQSSWLELGAHSAIGHKFAESLADPNQSVDYQIKEINSLP